MISSLYKMSRERLAIREGLREGERRGEERGEKRKGEGGKIGLPPLCGAKSRRCKREP